jgi:hypothetical protein
MHHPDHGEATIADLRVSLAPVSILVRPSVGVRFGFDALPEGEATKRLL